MEVKIIQLIQQYHFQKIYLQLSKENYKNFKNPFYHFNYHYHIIYLL